MRQMSLVLIAVLSGLLLMGCGKSESPPPAPLSDAELEARARAFVELMQSGKHQDAVRMMDKTVASALPADRLKTTWDTLVTQAGDFDKITGVRLAEESGYRVVYVVCKFKAADIDTKVVFNVEGKIAGLWFGPSQGLGAEYKAPSYAQVDSFTEADVQFGEAEWLLPGTLSMPVGDGPFPAVVLVHGSGPNDRDETVGPNKPFKDLAMGLASRGIAVLRYEKRTKAYQQEVVAQIESFTVNEETVNDALAAVAFLKKTEGIDPNRVFIIGHSLGASMAPRMALIGAQSDDTSPAGLVMMAPNARPLLDLMLEQYGYLASLDGEVSQYESQEIEAVRAGIAKIKGGTMQPGEVVLGAAKAYWDDILAYDPVATAKSISVPLFILQGERDYQVTMEDFAIWSEALAGVGSAELKSFPGLNHLFIKGDGQPSPAEYNVPGNVDPDVIEDIAHWVKAH